MVGNDKDVAHPTRLHGLRRIRSVFVERAERESHRAA